MVVQNVIMEEDDDLEALRLAALQTIRPRKPNRRNMAPITVHRQLDKGPFFQSEVNPNLIAIVPSIIPPPAIDSGKLTADSTSKPSEISTKILHVTNKELNQNTEKTEAKADVEKTEKVDPPHRVSDEVKKEVKKDKSEIFDLEEDVLDFETESLAGSEEDTLQLHDSDSDSLERLMEQIEEELSSPVKTTRLKPKPAAPVPPKAENKVEINKSTSENISQNKLKPSQKPESPKPSINISERLSPVRRRYSPAQNVNPAVVSQSPPRRSRSPINHKRSLTPRKRSLTPRKRSLTPRKRSITPRKRSITPRKRSITPRKRSLTPRKRSLTPRKRSLSPRRRSITPQRRSLTPRKRSLTPRKRSLTPRKRSLSPRKRSLSPRRRSITPRKRSISPRRRSPWRFSPRRRSISPRHRRSVSPRRRSPIDRRRSPSLWRRSLSPRHPQSPRRRSPTPKKRSLSPRRRSLTPKKRSLSPRKRSLSPRRRSVSPKQNSPLKRQRVRSPMAVKRGKRLSPVAGRRNWLRNKTASVSNRLNNPSKNNFNSNNKNQKDDERRKRGEVKDNKPKEKDIDLVDGKSDTDIKNGEIKPLDPKLEARRRKFETNSIVEPLNKKIRLKSESLRGSNTDGARSDENQSLRVKRKRIVLSNENNKSSEKASEGKAKPLLPKVTNNVKKTEDKKADSEEVVVKKKRKEIAEDSSKEDSNKKGVDLRAELSRRRAERLKGASIDPMARIVQSAIEGAVGKIKTKSRTSPVSETEAPVAEKKSKPKGRRVHVLPANSSKSEDKKNNAEDKNVGISMHYRSSSPVRGSGRSILRRNQV
ncbi:unnamed protein product [Nezara viridula]|uniref:Uncharacterized protein n=1 Tax=Nezara viridula TaxID=85310 RepID=A0A9P0HKT7_NEZVI|nr:unnamed protein product [Nezara viridula]